MPALVEPDILSEDIANKIHDFNSDTFRWVLSNTAPNVASTFLLSNVTQIASGNGYTQMTDGAGGITATVGFSRSGQITTVATSNAPVVTASGGTIGPFIVPGELPPSTNEQRCTRRANMVLPITDVLLLLQRGYVDVGFMGGAQIDRFGNLNSSFIGEPDNPKIRLPGTGDVPVAPVSGVV